MEAELYGLWLIAKPFVYIVVIVLLATMVTKVMDWLLNEQT